jgi:hypothetical protein
MLLNFDQSNYSIYSFPGIEITKITGYPYQKLRLL